MSFEPGWLAVRSLSLQDKLQDQRQMFIWETICREQIMFAKKFLLSISETWVRCLLFPLLPDVCLLRRRLLCFLWRFKVCPAFMATAGGCVRALSVTAAVCSAGSKSKASNSILLPCLRKEESSEVGLHLKVSPSVTSSPWVLKFCSFIRAVERDLGFWDFQLAEEELL